MTARPKTKFRQWSYYLTRGPGEPRVAEIGKALGEA
jgi:hypothetical protein